MPHDDGHQPPLRGPDHPVSPGHVSPGPRRARLRAGPLVLAIGAVAGLAAVGAATPAGRDLLGIIPLPLQPVVPASQRLCSATTASGLGYTVLRAGQGPQPAPDDYVLVNYIGYLAQDGKVFDQGMRAPLTVDGVIPGFSEGLKQLQRGGIRRFCIPAALGYGPAGAGPIPANAALVFQVELVDFRTKAEVEAMRTATDPAAPASGPAPGTAP